MYTVAVPEMKGQMNGLNNKLIWDVTSHHA